MNAVGHGLVGVADAGAFLARLTRIDPAAPVRLRSAPEAGGEPRTTLWGRLPWQVLVTRTVGGPGPGEATVSAAELLATLSDGGEALPARRDGDWRWPLPPNAGRVVERVGADEVIRVARAAAGTLRTATATRRVGERVVRDALLDHVAIVVTDGGTAADAESIEVPQRLVQAILKMGFLGPIKTVTPNSVQVLIAGKWTGLSAPYGTAWLRQVNEFAIRPLRTHPNG